MEWVQIVLNAFFVFLLGLFIKNYFPEYMKEKGKNLATKEDIEEITRKTELVQKEFKESFELFSSDVQFKYDFYFKQYANLYSNLYCIVMQSEYVRHFIKINDGKDITFEDAPFIELSPTQRVSQEIKSHAGEPPKFSSKTESIQTALSDFNKKQLCDYIIGNAEYASQKLIKVAVAYRFAYNYYSGNSNVKNASCQETADNEEFRLIREMVCCIVSDYNSLRKELKMEYNESELSTGIPSLNIILE